MGNDLRVILHLLKHRLHLVVLLQRAQLAGSDLIAFDCIRLGMEGARMSSTKRRATAGCNSMGLRDMSWILAHALELRIDHCGSPEGYRPSW
jgi:hypothetical protein